jgi:hypothetical protein
MTVIWILFKQKRNKQQSEVLGLRFLHIWWMTTKLHNYTIFQLGQRVYILQKHGRHDVSPATISMLLSPLPARIQGARKLMNRVTRTVGDGLREKVGSMESWVKLRIICSLAYSQASTVRPWCLLSAMLAIIFVKAKRVHFFFYLKKFNRKYILDCVGFYLFIQHWCKSMKITHKPQRRAPFLSRRTFTLFVRNSRNLHTESFAQWGMR